MLMIITAQCLGNDNDETEFDHIQHLNLETDEHPFYWITCGTYSRWRVWLTGVLDASWCDDTKKIMRHTRLTVVRIMSALSQVT